MDLDISSLPNKRVLFLNNAESGLGNVFLATAHALLLDHPDIELHIASFPKQASAVAEVSAHAVAAHPPGRVQPITFHPLHGKSYVEMLAAKGIAMDEYLFPPGIRGALQLYRQLADFLVPWDGPSHLEIYTQLAALLQTIDPGVTVVDTVFAPAIDAVRQLKRPYILLSANPTSDVLRAKQQRPPLAALWKLPAINSGYAYPVPAHLIPANILLNLAMGWSLLRLALFPPTRAYLRRHGLPAPSSVFTLYHPSIPWISPSSPSSDFPNPPIPAVHPVGPIILRLPSSPTSTAAEELTTWLHQPGRRTILLALGSHTTYPPPLTAVLASFLAELLDTHPDLQVLWKYTPAKAEPKATQEPSPSPTQEPPALTHLQQTHGARIHLTPWIPLPPSTLLSPPSPSSTPSPPSTPITLSIHHAGANSFFEALSAGVPQLLLPLWGDCYGFAARAEWLGVGVWVRSCVPRRGRVLGEGWEKGDLGRGVERLLDVREGFEGRAREVAGRIEEEGRVRESREEGGGGARGAAGVVVTVLGEVQGREGGKGKVKV